MAVLARIPGRTVLEARLRASDQPGRHLWVMAAAWRVSDPQAYSSGRGEIIMDAESLVCFTGPGCFKCEQPWSRKLQARPCNGVLG